MKRKDFKRIFKKITKKVKKAMEEEVVVVIDGKTRQGMSACAVYLGDNLK